MISVITLILQCIISENFLYYQTIYGAAVESPETPFYTSSIICLEDFGFFSSTYASKYVLFQIQWEGASKLCFSLSTDRMRWSGWDCFHYCKFIIASTSAIEFEIASLLISLLSCVLSREDKIILADCICFFHTLSMCLLGCF